MGDGKDYRNRARRRGRQPESIFDFVQGITALARTKSHQDARLELEGKAKRLMERAIENMGPRNWRRLRGHLSFRVRRPSAPPPIRQADRRRWRLSALALAGPSARLARKHRAAFVSVRYSDAGSTGRRNTGVNLYAGVSNPAELTWSLRLADEPLCSDGLADAADKSVPLRRVLSQQAIGALVRARVATGSAGSRNSTSMRALSVKDRNDPLTEFIAKKIIRNRPDGYADDPTQISARAIQELAFPVSRLSEQPSSTQ